MSTLNNPPATPGNPGIPRDVVGPQQPVSSYDSHRASRYSRQSHAESSTSGSRWSAIEPQSRSPSNYGASSSYLGSDDGKKDRPVSSVLPRRNHHRGSGGFLLELATPSSRLSRTLLSKSQKDSKGKRKSDNFEISVSKRGSQASTLENGSAFQSSPLSVNTVQDQEQRHTLQDKSENFNEQPEQSLTSTNRHGTPTSQRSGKPSAGMDADSAQVVDMALRLSEGRRRQASGKRFVSGELPESRVVSSPTRQFQNPPKSLGQYLASQNAGNISPIPASPVRDTTEAADVGNSMLMNRPVTPYTPQSRLPTTEENTLEISQATIARVEKAKTYLELAYEHRRLLSHLPPIVRPGTPARDSAKVPQSKIYNPLQYARNRKLRLREKSDINAEGEGWYEVEKVRVWVDAVANSHSETIHDPLECVRLPPLSLQKREEDEPENAYHSPRAANQNRNKPRRPKSDWVTHPGDLIADAFWLEQGLNKTKIHDRDNHPIYPPDTPFKFSGWRNRTPGDIPERLQQPTPPPEELSHITPAAPLTGAPELPTFRPTHRKSKDVSRGRKRSKIKDSISKAQSDSRRRALGLLDSSTGSDSDMSSNKSDDEGLRRGRTRSFKEFDLPDGDPFDRPVASARRQYTGNGTTNSSDVNLSEHSVKRSSVDQARLTNILKRNSMLKSSSNERSNSRSDTKKRRLFKSSREFHDDERHGQSSAEYDSASPNSPVNFGLPSIAANLDAPISRSPSPTKRSKSKFFHPHKDKPRNIKHEKVESVDFASHRTKSHSRDASIDTGKRRGSSNQTSRGTSPLTRGTSPLTKNRQNSSLNGETVANVAYPRSAPVSRVSTRSNALASSHDQSSRIRGMFKGGRIAELVGNEVSRVGDFIWKREPPHTYRHPLSGSDASFRSYYPSDTDEETHGAQIFKTPTRDARPSTATQSSSGGRKSFESPRSIEATQLHHPNLPSFTSPFQRDRERQEKKPDLLNLEARANSGDHISRQAAQHRAISKSPRLEGLAPPKLEITAPQSAGIVERKNSYGFGEALARSQSASRTFNNAMKQSGEDISRKDSLALSNPFRKSLTDNLQVDSSECIRKRDISRLQALLLISAVKAKNISASYEQVPPEPSRFLQEMTTNSDRLPRVRRRDEYIFAAREIISALEGQTDQINTQLHVFSDKGVAKLHRDIQGIEDQIENSITPRVRATADSAAELSVKLTTTSTQAVKGLQDIVTEAFRIRRRGPFRWVRLLGFKIIEWIVVGLLWFIWAIVTFCKVFIGLFRGVGRLTTWLLWVDR